MGSRLILRPAISTDMTEKDRHWRWSRSAPHCHDVVTRVATIGCFWKRCGLDALSARMDVLEHGAHGRIHCSLGLLHLGDRGALAATKTAYQTPPLRGTVQRSPKELLH